jgi:hypothetical protein
MINLKNRKTNATVARLKFKRYLGRNNNMVNCWADKFLNEIPESLSRGSPKAINSLFAEPVLDPLESILTLSVLIATFFF